MGDYLSSEDLLAMEMIHLKQRIESKDFEAASKAASRISKICKRLRPDYDYSCNLGDYERIMTALSSVDYGVGKFLPEVVW